MLTLFAFVALAGVSHQDPVIDPVKILGRDIPVEFPATAAVNDSAAAEIDGWKWSRKNGGLVWSKFRKDGSWSDIRDLWLANRPGPNAKPYPVKVVILQNSSVLSRSAVGVVRHDWATIDDEELETVLKSLALFKVAVEAATNGEFAVRLDVSLDDDIYADYRSFNAPTGQVPDSLQVSSAINSSGLDADSRWIAEEVAPRLNDEKFDTDDGTYNGPFAAVFVVHPRLPVADRVWTVDRTPVATIGYYKFSPVEAKVSLPATLFETWKAMLWPNAAGPLPNLGTENVAPQVESGDLWNALARRSLRSKSLEPKDIAPLKTIAGLESASLPTVSVPVATNLPAESPRDANRTIVSLNQLDYLARKLPSASITGVGASAGKPFAELDQPLATIVATLVVTPRVEPNGTVREAGKAVGDFTAKAIQGPDGSPGWEVSFQHNEPRGWVTVAAGSPLVPTQKEGSLVFQAKLSVDENVLLDLYGVEGARVASVMLGGDMPTELEDPSGTLPLDASVTSDDQWHQVSVPLAVLKGAGLSSIVLRGGPDRLSRGPAVVSLTTPKVVEGPSTGTTVAPNPAIVITKTSNPPTADQAQAILDALASANLTVRLTALDVLTRIKMPESVLSISTVSRSGFAPVAAMAMRALAFQDTPDAWAVIREAVERGPFDHNRRFAARQLISRPDPAMAASLNFLATRSALARLESVKALAMIKTTSAQIIMAALLQSEPSACVRLQIVNQADIKVDLVARRMLYAAVNDSSQWVRAVALSRLLDSTNKAIRSEALNGVKDEAVGVRLYLLDRIRERANLDDRPALRVAVTDLNAPVRASALRAFATQPGPVDPNEVKNTFNDPDPAVKAALAELSKAKNLKVPA